MIRPIKDNIVIETAIVEETTKSGVFKGDSVLAEEKKTEARVVLAIGRDVKEVKEGDLIFLRNGTTVYNYRGSDDIIYGVVSEHSVVAIS